MSRILEAGNNILLFLWVYNRQFYYATKWTILNLHNLFVNSFFQVFWSTIWSIVTLGFVYEKYLILVMKWSEPDQVHWSENVEFSNFSLSKFTGSLTISCKSYFFFFFIYMEPICYITGRNLGTNERPLLLSVFFVLFCYRHKLAC